MDNPRPPPSGPHLHSLIKTPHPSHPTPANTIPPAAAATVMQDAPDWSELPRELLSEISQKLPTLSGYIRFRSVCPTWRSSAKPSGAPPTSPCLLLDGDDRAAVHSLSTDTTYVLSIPELRGRRVCGSSSGWLLLAETASPVLTLLNPLTGSQIPLPPSPFTGCDVDAAFLSSAPTSPACAVLVSLSETSDIAFFRLGCRHWTIIQTRLPVTATGSYELAYHNGKLFAVDDKGLTSISVPGLKEPTLLAPPETDLIVEHLYLVLDESTDELLLVGSYIHMDSPYGDQKMYCIFKLEEGDEARGPPRWVNVSSIGRRSLLLCDCQSMSVVAGGCRGSCLYTPETLMRRGAWHQDIVVYDWRTCDIWRLQCKSECCVWFGCSPPAWFVPSL